MPTVGKGITQVKGAALFDRPPLHFSTAVYTATMTTIDQASLGSISVMLPPLQVQSEFATLKKRIEQEQSIHNHFATELDAFFASLQQRAFRGEL